MFKNKLFIPFFVTFGALLFYIYAWKTTSNALKEAYPTTEDKKATAILFPPVNEGPYKIECLLPRIGTEFHVSKEVYDAVKAGDIVDIPAALFLEQMKVPWRAVVTDKIVRQNETANNGVSTWGGTCDTCYIGEQPNSPHPFVRLAKHSSEINMDHSNGNNISVIQNNDTSILIAK